jgi:hypothetical protein
LTDSFDEDESKRSTPSTSGGDDGDRFRPGLEIAKSMAIAGTLGMQFALACAAGLFLGHRLDGLLGSKPWFLVILGLVGAAGALQLMIATARRFGRGGERGEGR